MIDRVLRVQSQLTDRDHVLLGWLADHGVLTTSRSARALFPSLDFAQRRLRKLLRLGLLTGSGRSGPTAAPTRTTTCSTNSASRSSPPNAVSDLPRRDQARRRRWHLTNRANLPHLLGVNGFFTDLAGYARTHPGARLARWWPAARCQQMGAFADDGDDVHVARLHPAVRPDGHGIWAEDGGAVPFFLEYDTGTEDRSPPGRQAGRVPATSPQASGRPGRCCSGSRARRERHLHQH